MAEPRFDVTSLGEMLLRLSVPSGERLEAAKHLDVYPAGTEANVMTLLSRLEKKTYWSGALPQNSPGRLAENALRIAGVDTNGIVWNQNGRMGTYYVEFGSPPRGIQVTYDRAYSCMTQLKPDEIDWDSLLDTRLLHLTGITPALSSSCREIVERALDHAKQRGVPVSFDINYRQKLWSEVDAQKTLAPMMHEVELLFCSARDATLLFNCKGTMQEIAQGMLEISHAKYVVITFGEQGALLWDGREWLHEASRAPQIIDRLGAGDALAAGVILGWLDGDLKAGLRYGVTLAALALSQFGDMVITNKQELITLSQGDSTLTR
ncbi:MAG: sugar kinase [Anaerolineae bacterium]|nr:sugar kinase [Anaerolineae bacterium]MCI0608462.1 sugar kinase [Anaerolineae bacterium]